MWKIRVELDVKEKIELILLLLFAGLLIFIVRASVTEHTNHIYFEIVFLLLLAVAGELIVIHLRLPSAMILMVLGILLSSSFSGIAGIPKIIYSENIIQIFSQLGAIILLFKVGLHSKVEKIFCRENLLVAVAGVLFPFVVGYFYASITGGNFAYSLFLGAALTATSVGVTVAILKEAGILKERFAQTIIGAAIIDDILGLLVLSVVMNLTTGNIGNVSSGSPLALGFTIGFAFGSAAVFVVGGMLAGTWFIQYLDRKEFNARRFLLVLCLILFYAYVAEFIQLSAIVGAFIAGLILNRSRHIEEIEEKTYSLEMLFTPIFFISLGMLIDVRALGKFALPILAITVLAMLTKIVPCMLASILSGFDRKESLLVGIGMAPRGEVALIVTSLGLSAGILDATQYSIISAMALLTSFAVPPILARLIRTQTQDLTRTSS